VSTTAKVDLYKLILENVKGTEEKQADEEVKKVVEQVESKIVYACPHCKKELC
jgi:hypothetical protein